MEEETMTLPGFDVGSDPRLAPIPGSPQVTPLQRGYHDAIAVITARLAEDDLEGRHSEQLLLMEVRQSLIRRMAVTA